MSSVVLQDLRKVFPDGTVGLHDFSLRVADREFLTFLGPSGCGKTTTLRMVAGLEHPTSGSIHFGDRRVDRLTAGERNVAMVFQSYALYPHMTVRQNLEYPLRKRRVAEPERSRRVAETATMLKLTPLLDRRPRQLSGGQQQRVALGRAMVRDSDVFLLDEPLSNLDAELRTHMRSELIKLHQTLGRTMIYVTHDQMEAMTMSTRIAVLSQGRLQQIGTPDEIYRAPANRFVAGFVGSPAMSFVEGEIVTEGDAVRFRSAAIVVDLVGTSGHALAGFKQRDVIAGVRAEDVLIVPQGAPATVELVERTGHETLVWLNGADGTRLVARSTPELRASAGDTVSVAVRRLHLFSPATGERMELAG